MSDITDYNQLRGEGIRRLKLEELEFQIAHLQAVIEALRAELHVSEQERWRQPPLEPK